MEIVLQWLDELDDLVFAGFSLWHRLRRLCLAVALAAAVGLHALPLLGVAAIPALGLLQLAFGALVVWSVIGFVTAAAAQSRHSMASGA